MNFISTFEELNKLYEEIEPVELQEEVVEEACAKEAISEAAEEEFFEDEVPVEEPSVEEEAPVEEPVDEDEPRQVILECDKCGALVIKTEADVVTDEESDLVNVEDECAFCEEAAGYKIVGVVAPYEVAEEEIEVVDDEEPVEEAVQVTSDKEDLDELLDVSVPVNVTANDNEVAVGGMTR